MNNINQFKILNDYIDVTVDKEFAVELIPIIELATTDTFIVEKISIFELSLLKRLYVKHCLKKNLITKSCKRILENSINITRHKMLVLLDVLYDIVQEDTPGWKKRWDIKRYNRIEYNNIETKIGDIKSSTLEPKPEYKEKIKENKIIEKHNKKCLKICQKWRKCGINFYKKIIKIINQ